MLRRKDIHKRNEELAFKFVKCQCDEACDSNYEKSSIYNEKMLKCNEFRVATHHGLGPYRKFGLSRIFGTWNYVIGDNQIIYFFLCFIINFNYSQYIILYS